MHVADDGVSPWSVERPMSAQLKLTIADLRGLGAFLAAMTEATLEHGVRLDAYGRFQVRLGNDAVLAVVYDEDRAEYVIDDRNGD